MSSTVNRGFRAKTWKSLPLQSIRSCSCPLHGVWKTDRIPCFCTPFQAGRTPRHVVEIINFAPREQRRSRSIRPQPFPASLPLLSNPVPLASAISTHTSRAGAAQLTREIGWDMTILDNRTGRRRQYNSSVSVVEKKAGMFPCLFDPHQHPFRRLAHSERRNSNRASCSPRESILKRWVTWLASPR